MLPSFGLNDLVFQGSYYLPVFEYVCNESQSEARATSSWQVLAVIEHDTIAMLLTLAIEATERL